MPSEDSKPVKKGEFGDEKNSRKPSNNATPKSRSPKLSKVKKQESDDEDEKPIAKRSSIKIDKVQKKSKVKKEEEKKKGAKEAEQNGKKREKKVFDLPGQKRDPPEERDPLRIFYETLYEQVPDSEMAAFWMMESGLLTKEVAERVFVKKQKKNHLQKLGSPMKASTVKKSSHSVTVKKKPPSSPASSQKKKTPDSKVASKQSKKRKIEDDASEEESDDDYVLAERVAKKKKAA